MNQGRESSDSTELVCFHTGLNYDGEYNFPARNYKLDEEFADFVKSQQCKYITKEDGYYIVSREIKGKREIFGKFTTLEFARDFETNLIINSWNNYFPLNVSRFGKYLFKRRGKFYISRTVHGKKRHYESFDNLSDAIKAREELIENNWNFKTFKIKMRCDPYIKINYENERIQDWIIKIGEKEFKWKSVLKGINDYIRESKKATDKQMGDFFIMPNGNDKTITFEDFRDKVLFYLFNDVFKGDRSFFAKDNNRRFFEDFFSEGLGEKDVCGWLTEIGIKSIESDVANTAEANNNNQEEIESIEDNGETEETNN